MGRERGLVPSRAGAMDLMQVRIGALHGADIADVAQETLDTGKSLLAQWNELEPIVRQLTALLRQHVEAADPEWAASPVKAANLLATVASVVEKTSRSAQSVLKASEGLSRLAVLIMGGVPERPDTAKLSEKQLAGVVVEACRRMYQEQGICPVCAAQPIEAEVVA